MGMGNIGKTRPKRSRKSAADFRVVYISNPMKVKATASEFRDLVQKLTGQDSDAERFMELINGASSPNPHDLHQTAVLDPDHHLVSRNKSPLDPPEDAFFRNFDGIFQNLFHESS